MTARAFQWSEDLPGLQDLCSLLLHCSFLSFLSTSFPGGPAGNQQREKVIEVLRRNCLGEEEAGSKGEQLRSDVIQLCGEESSMNIMINFLIIRSLSWQNSSPRGNGGNPIAWSFLIRLEKHSWKRLQRESPTLGGGDGHVTYGGGGRFHYLISMIH